MARPKLGKGDSERLQMVITCAELDAVEDWRFRNRVQSKSEAVRRLVQIGLRLSQAMPYLDKITPAIFKATRNTAKAIHEIDVARGEMVLDGNERTTHLVLTSLLQLYKSAGPLLNLLQELRLENNAMVENENFEAGLDELLKYKGWFDKTIPRQDPEGKT